MKKFLTGIVVLSLASMAFAVPVFDINGGTTIEIDIAGGPVTVPVNVTGSAGVGGYNLNLEAFGPFEITNLVVDGTTIWAGKIPSGWDGTMLGIDMGMPTLAVSSMATTGAIVPNSGVVAWVTIGLSGEAKLNDTGSMVTTNFIGDSALLALAGGDAIESVQGSVNLLVVPEPVSALLLLAGLPLIRRRRA